MEAVEDQSEVFAFLADPATHGLRDKITRIDTHGAVVFLAGSDVYKVKRAVFFPFMDFSSLEKRRAACENEIAVNRENAPDLYLGVMPVRRGASGLQLGGTEGAIVEWTVHLRRFDEGKTLDRLAERGELDLEIGAALAEVMVAAHERAPRRKGGATADLQRRLEETIVGLGEDPFAPSAVEALAARLRAAFQANETLLLKREDMGKVRLCHGDAHLHNIVLERGRPVLFDAIEFDDAMATVDIFYDLAFLLMDLWQRHLHAHANLVLNRYLWRCAEPEQELEALAALPLFLALRAAIRARVTAALGRLEKAEQGKRYAQAMSFFEAAAAFLAPKRALLVGIGGLSGTGKSTLAKAFAPFVGRPPGAIHLRSDIERKRLFGIGEYERLPEAAYRPDVTEQVYRRLREFAEVALSAGQSIVVDAVHAKAREREALREIATHANVPFAGLWLEAPAEVLVARVEARKEDASDATPAVVREQMSWDLERLDWQRFDASQPAGELARIILEEFT
ncbi:MAG TPA: AAA family ATPase [Methylovirgula sp.]|nr:AAA family ATPase [Methylovirgula sp.]